MKNTILKIIGALVLGAGIIIAYTSLNKFNILGMLLGFILAIVGGVVLALSSETNNQKKTTSSVTNQDNSVKTNESQLSQYISEKKLIKSNSEQGISHIRNFKVAGVTFDNRQKYLELLYEVRQEGGRFSISLNKFLFNSEIAVAIIVNGFNIGVFNKNDLSFILENEDRICGFKDIYIGKVVNDNGKTIYYAEIKLVLINKT